MEDEFYKSQEETLSSSHAKVNKDQNLEIFVSELSKSHVTQILKTFKPLEVLQKMDLFQLQEEMCNHSRKASPDDPLSYVKDLSCLVETVAQKEESYCKTVSF